MGNKCGIISHCDIGVFVIEYYHIANLTNTYVYKLNTRFFFLQLLLRLLRTYKFAKERVILFRHIFHFPNA